MRSLSIFVAAILLATFSGTTMAQEESLNLTLKEALRIAVEKNLDVKAELYNPAAAEADIRKFRGIYDPLLSLLTNFQNSNTLPASTFLSGAQVNRQKTLKYNAEASQLIPSGGTVGLSFDNTWISNNSDPTRFTSKYYQSALTLTLSQPLLQNFGRETTELNISVAKYGKEGALEQFRNRLMDIISQVRTQYFQLHTLREDLEVKKTSLALAEKILNDTQAQVKAGVLPAMEILNAEFGVATRQKDLIDAERALRDQTDVLRLLLQLPVQGEIVPVDALSRERYQFDEAAEIQRAIAARPDLKQLQANLKADELQARVARNQTLPSLNLNASTALTGLAGDYNRDLERVASTNFPIWGIGLQLTYPIGNHAAENDYIKSNLKVAQTRTQVRSLEESIAYDVKTAVRAIQSSYKQLEVTTRGRAYAEERLKAFIKRNQVGLATTKDVLDVENDLVTAKGNEIKALSDYSNAINQLWKATGELLEREGIRVTEKEADALYERQSKNNGPMP
ncbi:MAG: outer membrane efflux [Geobacteraceae bacterium]|nr:MAG: outer membrane efflux [Geobacteraceae bacterium]